jgi:hypothetical protein
MAVKEKRRCKKCNAVVFPSELPEYTYECFDCDEDLYEFETYQADQPHEHDEIAA